MTEEAKPADKPGGCAVGCGVMMLLLSGFGLLSEAFSGKVADYNNGSYVKMGAGDIAMYVVLGAACLIGVVIYLINCLSK